MFKISFTLTKYLKMGAHANSIYDKNDPTPLGTYHEEMKSFKELLSESNPPIKISKFLFDKEHIRSILAHPQTELIKVFLGIDSENRVQVYITGVLENSEIGPEVPGVAHAPK